MCVCGGTSYSYEHILSNLMYDMYKRIVVTKYRVLISRDFNENIICIISLIFCFEL